MQNEFSSLSYERLNQHAAELDSASKDMDRILNEVRGLLARVGSEDMWAGTAAMKTKEAFEQLAAKFPQFVQSVRECQEQLKNVVTNFQEVDNMASNG